MRNFTAISPVNSSFLSMNVSNEYLTGDPAEVIRDVLHAMALCFGESTTRVMRAFQELVSSGTSSHLCNSEIRALSELYIFWQNAVDRWNNYSIANCNTTIVYTYANLNDGKVVTWSSVVA